jgi:hypothetical protein
MVEWRARYECAIQYRTYMNMKGLADSYFESGEYNIGSMLSEQAYQHRKFSRNCAWIATGRFK